MRRDGVEIHVSDDLSQGRTLVANDPLTSRGYCIITTRGDEYIAACDLAKLINEHRRVQREPALLENQTICKDA